MQRQFISTESEKGMRQTKHTLQQYQYNQLQPPGDGGGTPGDVGATALIHPMNLNLKLYDMIHIPYAKTQER